MLCGWTIEKKSLPLHSVHVGGCVAHCAENQFYYCFLCSLLTLFFPSILPSVLRRARLLSCFDMGAVSRLVPSSAPAFLLLRGLPAAARPGADALCSVARGSSGGLLHRAGWLPEGWAVSICRGFVCPTPCLGADYELTPVVRLSLRTDCQPAFAAVRLLRKGGGGPARR